MTDHLDPAIKALVDKLPPPGRIWPEGDRTRWLDAMRAVLGVVYVDAEHD